VTFDAAAAFVWVDIWPRRNVPTATNLITSVRLFKNQM